MKDGNPRAVIVDDKPTSYTHQETGEKYWLIPQSGNISDELWRKLVDTYTADELYALQLAITQSFRKRMHRW